MTNALYAAKLITLHTKDEILDVSGSTDYMKASKLVIVIERQLEASSDKDEYLIDTCEVLRKQQSPTLTKIANGELCGLY